jgi:hypothetical protein
MVSPSRETSQKKRLLDLEIDSDSAKTQGTPLCLCAFDLSFVLGMTFARLCIKYI